MKNKNVVKQYGDDYLYDELMCPLVTCVYQNPYSYMVVLSRHILRHVLRVTVTSREIITYLYICISYITHIMIISLI
jgi:hypothetical protein